MDFDFADILLEVIARRRPTCTSPPARRRWCACAGACAPLEGFPSSTPTDTREIVYSILTNDQRQRLETDWQLDFAYSMPGHGALPRQRLLPARARSAPPSA